MLEKCGLFQVVRNKRDLLLRGKSFDCMGADARRNSELGSGESRGRFAVIIVRVFIIYSVYCVGKRFAAL